MRGGWLRVVVVAVALAGAAAAPAWADTVPVAAASLPFQVTLPPGFRVLKSRGPDFDVYYFNKGDDTYAGAYIGFAPSFHGPAAPRRVNGRSQIVECVAGQVAHREVLMFVGSAGNDEVIHAWTVKRASGAERDLAESILLSIRKAGVNDGFRRAELKGCG